MRVLFMCKGNVARSQIAEALLKKAKPEFEVFSAGVQDDTPAKYVHPSQEVIQVMAEIGIDVSNQRVKTINRGFIDNTDKIIYMCNKSELPDYLYNSQLLEYWDIKDPCGTGIETFRKIRDEIRYLIQTTFE